MNTLKAVLRHLNKEEVNLSAEKVELGLTQDLAGGIKGVEVFSKNLDISLDILEKTFRAISVDKQDLSSDLSKLKKTVNKVEGYAKDLGVNPSEFMNYSEAIKAISEGEKKLKEFAKYK